MAPESVGFLAPATTTHHRPLPRPSRRRPLYNQNTVSLELEIMDKSLDEVRRVQSPNQRARLTLWKIIATTRPKGIRRSNPRRNSGKAQVLGTPATAPATRARAVPASNGAKTVPAATAAQPADKIIVSNLPPDVNEMQVKVRPWAHTYLLREVLIPFLGALPHDGWPPQGRHPPLRQPGPLKGRRCSALPAKRGRHQGVPTVQQPID